MNIYIYIYGFSTISQHWDGLVVKSLPGGRQGPVYPAWSIPWLLIPWLLASPGPVFCLRLCSTNHRAGCFSNLACDWLNIAWAYSEQATENGPGSSRTMVLTREYKCILVFSKRKNFIHLPHISVMKLSMSMYTCVRQLWHSWLTYDFNIGWLPDIYDPANS